MTREPTRSIQTGLNALGYSPSPIDGYYGKNTREAPGRRLAAGGQMPRRSPDMRDGPEGPTGRSS